MRIYKKRLGGEGRRKYNAIYLDNDLRDMKSGKLSIFTINIHRNMDVRQFFLFLKKRFCVMLLQTAVKEGSV